MEFRLSKGHFLGLFCAVVWGATFISTKVLLEYLSPLQILFSRFLLGYIALWCLYPHRSPKYGRKAQLLFALAGFLGTFLYFLMENVALQHTTASNVGVLVSLAPLFTAAVSKLENPKLTLSLQFFVGAVLSFVGVLLIVFGDNMSLVINPLGDTLALGAAFVLGSLFDRAQQAVCIQGAYSRFNKNDLRLWTNLYRCWRLVRRRFPLVQKSC